MTYLLSRRLFAIAASATLLFGGTLAQAQDKVMGDGGSVRLLTSPAGTMSIPPFIIKKFELDKKHGFNLDIVPYTTQNAGQAALQAKAVDIVVFDWVASARLRKAGVPLVGIAPFLTYVNSVLVPVNSPIKSLADLKGKKLGISDKTGFDWIMMLAAARKVDNINLAQTVTLQEGAVPLLRGSIEQGQLDATQIWNSLAPGMIASGKFKTLVTIRQLSEQMGFASAPFLFYGAHEAFLKDKPQNAKAFVAAYRDAVNILRTNDDVWVERGNEMKMSGEALKIFRDEVRADILERFTPDMSDTLNKTFSVLLTTAGAEALGMDSMPTGLISLDYQ